MDFSSISSHTTLASTTTTRWSGGHKESSSMTTIATTCIAVIIVIGVGVAVIFCKRFVETRNSDSDEEETSHDDRVDTVTNEMASNLYAPPSYNTLKYHHTDEVENGSLFINRASLVNNSNGDRVHNIEGNQLVDRNENKYNNVTGRGTSDPSREDSDIDVRTDINRSMPLNVSDIAEVRKACSNNTESNMHCTLNKHTIYSPAPNAYRSALPNSDQSALPVNTRPRKDDLSQFTSFGRSDGRRVNRTMSETLVYLPITTLPSSNRYRTREDIDWNFTRHQDVSKSFNDIDDLPSYEEAVKMSLHNIPFSS